MSIYDPTSPEKDTFVPAVNLDGSDTQVNWSTPDEVLDADLAPESIIAERLVYFADLKADNPATWSNEFSPSAQRMHLMLDDIEQVFGDIIEPDEFKHSHDFVTSIFDEYTGKVASNLRSSFGFIVPTRLSKKGFSLESDKFTDDKERMNAASSFRSHAGNEYYEEIEQFLPALRHLDPETRIQVFSAACPFVFENYGADSLNKRGVAVFAPVFSDMMSGYPGIGRARKAIRGIVNETVDFVNERYGVDAVGLGATLPIHTRYGNEITNPNVRVTTGHAGTVNIIGSTIQLAFEEDRAEMLDGNVGILGAGSIGLATSQYILGNNIARSVTLFDTDNSRHDVAESKLIQEFGDERVLRATNLDSLFEKSRTVASAVTSRVNPIRDINDLNLLEGLFVVDDSEPGAFTDPSFSRLGTVVAGVVGVAQRESMLRSVGYNNFGRQIYKGAYGCELELAAMYEDSRGRMDGIMRPVTSEDVTKVGHLFEEFDVSAAPIQRNGKLI